MILPGSYAISMLLVVLSFLCWGSWANTFKMTRNGWRFELYYLDFAFGLFAAAMLVAFTFGSLGFDGFSFTDDLLHAGKRQLVFGFCAGILFNLANMFLMGAVSIAGMAVSFPICLGLALVVSAVWNYLSLPAGNAVLLFTGVVIVLASVGFAAAGYRSLAETKLMALIQSGKAKSTKKKVSMKSVFLAAGGGLLMGCSFPLIQMAQAAEVGVGPYTSTVLLAIGVLMSTFVYNLFFMNLPVQGEPVEVTSYFRGGLRNHLLGFLGGVIWCLGLIAILVASSADGAAKASATAGSLTLAAPILCVLWGVFLWKEISGSDIRVKGFVAIMSVLFVIGLCLISTAPVMAR